MTIHTVTCKTCKAVVAICKLDVGYVQWNPDQCPVCGSNKIEVQDETLATVVGGLPFSWADPDDDDLDDSDDYQTGCDCADCKQYEKSLLEKAK